MNSIIVTDLFFGDSGKGTVVDFLTQSEGSQWTIKFSGGSNCAHNVVLPDGRHHTFSQFGAGTFHGAKTVLAEKVLFDPICFLKERDIGKFANGIVTVHQDCRIITPFHIYANRTDNKNVSDGTTGCGIGKTVKDYEDNPDCVLTAKDLFNVDECAQKLEVIRNRLNTTYVVSDGLFSSVADLAALYQSLIKGVINVCEDSWIAEEVLTSEKPVVFEGSQGHLLDENFGSFPNNTWSTTTSKNAIDLLTRLDYKHPVTKLGVMRSYISRHGAGAFPSEIKEIDFSFDKHNRNDGLQGRMRYGLLDQTLLRYSLDMSDVDVIAVSCLDQEFTKEYVSCYYDGKQIELKYDPSDSLPAVKDKWSRICSHYNKPWKSKYSSIKDWLKENFDKDVVLESYGPTYKDKKIII